MSINTTSWKVFIEDSLQTFLNSESLFWRPESGVDDGRRFKLPTPNHMVWFKIDIKVKYIIKIAIIHLVLNCYYNGITTLSSFQKSALNRIFEDFMKFSWLLLLIKYRVLKVVMH